MIKATKPTIVANTPVAGFEVALSTTSCIAAALVSPISVRSCSKIWPCAASRPNTKPAIDTAIIKRRRCSKRRPLPG
jgi:hypothetical protein